MPRTCLFISPLLLLLSLGAAAQEPPILEQIEWSDVWVVNADTSGRPKVLLVGDSIVKGYYDGVEKALGGQADLARYATSLFVSNPDYLAELRVLLRRYAFEVIHINNGLHGFGYTEEQYRQGLEALVALLREEEPQAKVIWAATTPLRDRSDLTRLDESNARAVERNRIAAEIMAKKGIPVNDLYALVADQPGYFSGDGVHHSEAGREALAKQVASVVSSHLPKADPPAVDAP